MNLMNLSQNCYLMMNCFPSFAVQNNLNPNYVELNYSIQNCVVRCNLNPKNGYLYFLVLYNQFRMPVLMFLVAYNLQAENYVNPNVHSNLLSGS
jgi:hypothetical protein